MTVLYSCDEGGGGEGGATSDGLGMPAVPFPHRTAMSLDNTALRSEHTDGTYTYESARK